MEDQQKPDTALTNEGPPRRKHPRSEYLTPGSLLTLLYSRMLREDGSAVDGPMSDEMLYRYSVLCLRLWATKRAHHKDGKKPAWGPPVLAKPEEMPFGTLEEMVRDMESIGKGKKKKPQLAQEILEAAVENDGYVTGDET